MNNNRTKNNNKEKNEPNTFSERALRTSLNVLAYGECTEQTLRYKLEDKGFDKESIDFAVQYMKNHRYLDEKRYLFRLVEYTGNSRLYGRRRIILGLRQKGFSNEILENYLEEALERVDERENCRKALSRVRKDSEKKTVEALLRRGFQFGDIRAVMQEAASEENEEF